MERTRVTKRTIWLMLTVIFMFLSGAYAATGDWTRFWKMLGLWVFTSCVLASCYPGQKHLQ